MTTQTVVDSQPAPTHPAPADPAPPTWQVPRVSARSVGGDLAYLISGFFLSLLSFMLLVTLFSLGAATAVVWIGIPILSFMLLTATGFARENRELLRRWGAPVAEPTYRGRGRLLQTLLDPKAWLEALHGTLVAFPLRTVNFVVAVSWVAGALGGLTWFLWGHFLPEGDYSGLAWLATQVTGRELPGSAYVAESVLTFGAGVILLVTSPFVVRACANVDASAARALLGALGGAGGRG